MSEVSICNSALLKLGLERIISLDDANKRAILCKEQYPKMRDEVLRAHPWNFALKRAEFTKTGTIPAFEFEAEFQKPTDCLRIVKAENQSIEFIIEGDKVLTNQDVFKAQYIYKLTDTTLFDKNFEEVLALRLAADLAYPLIQSTTVENNKYQLYLVALKDSRSFDAQEGTPPSLIDDSFILSRL